MGLGQLGWDRLSAELFSKARLGFPSGNIGASPPKLLNPRSAGTFLSFLVSALRKLVRRRNRKRTPFRAEIVLALDDGAHLA